MDRRRLSRADHDEAATPIRRQIARETGHEVVCGAGQSLGCALDLCADQDTVVAGQGHRHRRQRRRNLARGHRPPHVGPSAGEAAAGLGHPEPADAAGPLGIAGRGELTGQAQRRRVLEQGIGVEAGQDRGALDRRDRTHGGAERGSQPLALGVARDRLVLIPARLGLAS
jgi:hypothetical protein